VYHSTLGWRVRKKKKKVGEGLMIEGFGVEGVKVKGLRVEGLE